jgi:hypothetical protein
MTSIRATDDVTPAPSYDHGVNYGCDLIGCDETWIKDILNRLPKGVEMRTDHENSDQIFYLNHQKRETSWNPFTWGDTHYIVKPRQPEGLAISAALKRRTGLTHL